MSINPVYGLDNISAEQIDRRLCERIKCRFDVIVLSELIRACKYLLFDIDNRSRCDNTAALLMLLQLICIYVSSLFLFI